MEKSSKIITAIVGAVTLAVGLIALPVVAQTTQQQEDGLFGQMQNLHNSQGMQDAMQAGDVEKMQELMNSDPAVKTQMGQESLERINQFMSNSDGSMITNGSGMTGSKGIMMNENENGNGNGNGNAMRSQLY